MQPITGALPAQQAGESTNDTWDHSSIRSATIDTKWT